MTMQTASAMTVWGYYTPPTQPNYAGGGFTMAGVHFSSGSGPTVPTYYIYNLIGQNNDYYYENYEDESRHYVDPESKKGTGDALFNHLIPEVSKLPKYMGELFSSVLTEGQFSALKGGALKNNVITPD